MGAATESLIENDEDLPPGTMLCRGKFVIESVICSGGFGIVYRAQRKSGKLVAIKEFFVEGISMRRSDLTVYAPDACAGEIGELFELFGEEGWWPGLLSHPNVMRVIDFFKENGTGYVVLEFIDGNDLQDIMEHHPDWLDPDQIVRIAEQLTGGLTYLHANGVVHGDIAPDNVMMRGPDDPVLIDFGSALFDNERDPSGRKPMKLRAVKDGYSAPELYDRSLHPTAASDIYSLGATLYHMIAGVAPAPANHRTDDLVEEGVLSRFEGLYSPKLLSGIAKALSLVREERPTAVQFAQFVRLHSHEGALSALEPEPRLKDNSSNVTSQGSVCPRH